MARRSELRARRAIGVLVAGLVLVLVASVFDAAPLFVPGVALCVIGALAPVWVLWSARGARVHRTLAADRVLEGTPLRATLALRRPLGPAGWGSLEVVDPLSDTRVRLGGPGSPLRGSRAAQLEVEVSFPRRGEQRLAAPSLVARDPLELARARRVGDGTPSTVLVLPRTEPVRWLGAGGAGRLASGPGDGRSEALAATDLEGLRPYRPGTPASRIHWPALARGRGLIERRLQADADRRPLVVLDARIRGHDPAPLDAAVRAAASIVLALARDGGCGLLLPGQGRATPVEPELTGWAAVHARLAVVGTRAGEGGGDAPRAPLLSGAAGRSGLVVYVTPVCHQRLAAVLTGAARGGAVLVVPDAEVVDGRPRGVSGRAVPALSVSGCQGFVLGGVRAGARPRASGEAVAR